MSLSRSFRGGIKYTGMKNWQFSTEIAVYLGNGTRRRLSLYVSSPAVDVESTVSQLMACVVDVNDWMRANRLRLNVDKTQLIWLESWQQLEKINVADVQFTSATLQPLPPSVRNLGVSHS